MNNIIFNFKRFLANKNTVTILGVVLSILILYFGYNYRVRQAIKPVRMPYAKETLQPRERITEEMIGYAEIPPGMIIGNVISNANLIVGRYTNYNTVIPAGSLFYRDSIVAAEELPDSAFLDIPEGNTPFNFPVDIESTYGNSIFPGNYINIYFKALDVDGKIIVGKLAENIKVLTVKDRTGKHVFENTEEERVPSTIIFAVPEEIHLLLRKAYYLGYVANINAELIPVPNTEAYYTEPGAVTITNQYLQAFINANTGYVPVDELPDVGEEPEYEEEIEENGENEEDGFEQ
jgi:hypothetical protein